MEVRDQPYVEDPSFPTWFQRTSFPPITGRVYVNTAFLPEEIKAKTVPASMKRIQTFMIVEFWTQVVAK